MEEQQYKLLDGKAVSAQMKQEMAEEVAASRLSVEKSLIWLPYWSVMMVEVKRMSQVK